MENTPAVMAEDCPCLLVSCAIHGNCVECVRVHRAHRGHIPECMQEVLRECIAELAKQVELGVVDERPEPADRKDQSH